MARIILSNGDTFNTLSGGEYIGGTGSEIVQVSGNPTTPVLVDGNIERLELTGALSTYTFRVNGNQVSIFVGANEVARISVQDDANGTVLAFADGGADLRLTGLNTATIGGQSVSTAAAPGAAVTAASMGTNFRTTNADRSFGGAGGTPVTPGTGQSFTLTNNATADAPALTAGNDTVTGAAGTLQTVDRIVDGSTTDTDQLTVTVNNYTVNTVEPLLVNVENVTVNGAFAQTGLDLTNVTGTRTLTLSGDITNTTGTVDDVASARVGSVVAGNNVDVLTVNFLAAGTGANVNVNSGAARTVTLADTGAGGNDIATLTATNSLTALTITEVAGAADNYTLNLAGGSSALTVTASAIENLAINTTGAAQTLTGLANALTGVAAGNGIAVNAGTNLTMVGNATAILGTTGLNGVSISKAGVGTLQFNSNTALAGASFFNRANLDVLNFVTNDPAQNVTVNQATTLRLSVTDVTNAMYNVQNATNDLAAGAGTLRLDVANSQANALSFGAQAGTVNLSTNGAAALAAITLTNLDINANVNNLNITGARNLNITTLTASANDIVNAGAFTGRLTVGTTTAATTVIGGEGQDSITLGNFASIVRGGAGNDTINAAAGSNQNLFGDAGNDSIVSGAGNDLIEGGTGLDSIAGADGNDTIRGGEDNDTIAGAAGRDSLSGGAGSDTFMIAANDTGVPSDMNFDVITDYVANSDVLDFATAILLVANPNSGGAAAGAAAVISATGLATFNAATTTLAQRITAVEAGIAASGGAAQAGEAAVFTDAGNTYLFISDANAGLTNTDVLIQLVGINATTGIVLNAGADIIAIS